MPRSCYWCQRFRRLTIDHVVPLAFGGWHAYNIVRACNDCNQERGHIAGLKINLFVAMHRTDQRAVTVQMRAVKKMIQSAPIFEKWRKIELDRYGQAITDKLGTEEYPFAKKYLARAAEQSESFIVEPRLYRCDPTFVGMRPAKAAFNTRRKFDHIAYCRWADDGGREHEQPV